MVLTSRIFSYHAHRTFVSVGVRGPPWGPHSIHIAERCVRPASRAHLM